ncbi:MAG TPA: flagellin [Nitrospira sp.]|nr:flagellin [Nitrospira sp.]
MRVTEQQAFSVLANDLQRAQSRLLEMQRQVSTGIRVALPSDDPSAFHQITLDQTSLTMVAQHLRNVNFSTGRLSLTDQLLSSVTSSLTQAQQLAVQFRSDTNTPSDRAAGAQQVQQIFGQLRQIANSDYNGHAVFGGTSTHGRATGLSVGVPATLTAGVNDSLALTVDGVTSGPISLGSGTLGGSALAALLQAKINSDPALSASGKTVTVAFETDHLVIMSNAYGPTSSVEVVGGSGLSTLGLNGGSTTTGTEPFALTATTQSAGTNSGGAGISQGRVSDPSRVTLDDYMIRFSSATTYDVLDVSAPIGVTPGASNTGRGTKTDAGVIDSSRLTLHDYQIQFTSATQYSIVDTTAGTTLSSGNTYVPGQAIAFDGLQVTLANGQGGGPQTGDTFSVSLEPRIVLANQSYTSGNAIGFDGIVCSIADKTGAPSAGDRFIVVTGTQYQGDGSMQTIPIGPGQTLQTNIPGSQAFGGPDIDIFDAMKRLATALRGNYGGGIAGGIADSAKSIEQITAAQGNVGALTGRLTSTSSSLQDAQTFLTDALSHSQDVDLTKAITDLTMQQYAVQAASATLARVFQNSLLNYLPLS